MAWVSAIVSLVGAGGSAANASHNASVAGGASKKQMQFSIGQYLKWQQTYGHLQDNLSKYYTELTPSKIATQDLQAYEQEYAKASANVDKMLAQRGITSDSGLAIATEGQLIMGKASARAAIRQNAEDKVLKQQTNFLQVGLGQNPVGMISDQLSQNTRYLQGISQQSNAAAASAISDATYAVGSAIYDYNQAQKEQELLNANATKTGGK